MKHNLYSTLATKSVTRAIYFDGTLKIKITMLTGYVCWWISGPQVYDHRYL